MSDFDQSKYLLKYLVIKAVLNIAIIVLIIINAKLMFIFSLGCHGVAFLLYPKEYSIWFKGIFSDFFKRFPLFTKEYPLLSHVFNTIHIVNLIGFFGLVEVYSFTQAKYLASIKV